MTDVVLPVDKSEILFLYESTYSIPNGDPFTGEQRYDEETKSVLVSDVRIKRFIRDYLYETGQDVYVRNDRTNVKQSEKEGDAESGAAARYNTLEGNSPKGTSAQDILTGMIDVRLFGGISTKKGNAVNLTGPVQFALLNPSLNAVELRMHQNTSVFSSSTDKARGAIGTTTVVPYALNQIHGWINPYSARHTNLSENDVQTMFKALWASINNVNTRTKSNQSSLLLLQVVYSDPAKKLYGLDRAIRIKPHAKGEEIRGEQIRSRENYDFDFVQLEKDVAASQSVKEVLFYTEDDVIKTQLAAIGKFREMAL
jgi:CRISPR-associated protein Csh2